MPLRPSAGTSTTAADPRWLAADSGYFAWTDDPALAATGGIVAAGTLQVVKVKVLAACTVTNVSVVVSTAGVTLTSGGCFAALASPAGVLLSTTATQHSAWQSTGLKAAALTTPQAITAGVYEVWLFSTGTTQPNFRAASGSAATANAGLATANSRFGTADTGLTTAMPSTRVAISGQQVSFWAALS